MKSVLALSVIAASTFLCGVSYAADSSTATSEEATSQASSEATKKPAKKHRAHRKHHKHKHAHYNHHHRHDHHHNGRHVHWHHVAPERDNNFYLGGEVGYAMQRSRFVTTFNSPFVPPLFVDSSHNVKVEDRGVLFGVLGGWQYRYMRWMFGLEGNVNFVGFEKNRPFNYTAVFSPTAEHVAGTVLYDRGDVYGLSGRVGYFVTPFFMPYIKAGAQFSRDELNYQAFYGPGTPPAVPSDFVSGRENIWAWLAGVGMEFPTYIGASTIRFEYNYSRAQSLVVDESTAVVLGTHKFYSPLTHTAKLAWVLNFM
jgi:opacity protein-like surface antigen